MPDLISKNKKKFVLICLILFFLLNLPVYINSTFISDDYSVIFLAEKNPFPVFTYYEKGLEDLIKNFQPETFKYRPLTSLSLFLNEKVTGLNSLGFHIVSLLIHLGIFILLFRIVDLLLNLTESNSSLLYFIPLFYLFNPSSANEISWIATRSDLLVVLFGTFSMLFLLKLLQSKKSKYIFLSAMFFSLSVMSKENGIFIPFLELIILFQMFIIKKKLFVEKKKILYLFGLNTVILGAYFLLRQYLSSSMNVSPVKLISFPEIIPVMLKTLFFVVLPMDSGSFSYMLDSNKVLSVLTGVIAIVPFIFYSLYGLKIKLIYYHFAALILIWLCSTSVFILLGGVSHRLLILTIAFSIPSVALGLIHLNSVKNFKLNLSYSFLIFYFLFYVSGYLFINSKWVENMKVEKACVSSIEKNFDTNKKYIAVTYPHSIGQTYCFSDIGLALYFRKNNYIGNYTNILQGAAINSMSYSGYKSGYETTKINETLFDVRSFKKDLYFTPGAYFTGECFPRDKFKLKGGLDFEVSEVNMKYKPTHISIQNENTSAIYEFVKFNGYEFEKIY